MHLDGWRTYAVDEEEGEPRGLQGSSLMGGKRHIKGW